MTGHITLGGLATLPEYGRLAWASAQLLMYRQNMSTGRGRINRFVDCYVPRPRGAMRLLALGWGDRSPEVVGGTRVGAARARGRCRRAI